MRFDIKTLIIVMPTALAACSGTPRRAYVVAAAPPQPAAIASATANKAPATATAEPAASAEKVDPNLVKAGYSVLRRIDQVLYCRTEVITGQRIGTRICLTAAQIQSERQNVTKARDLLNQPSYSCVGTSCSN
jgi:nucleoid-associated protein YgaU